MVLKKDKLTYKLLTFDELIINLDRLTRFKLPEESYVRVFNSILYKNLITPKYSKKDLEKLPSHIVSKYVRIIWNDSVTKLFPDKKNNNEVNKVLELILKQQFKNIDEYTQTLVNTNLLISPLIEKSEYESIPKNLKILFKANQIFNDSHPAAIDELNKISTKYKLRYPVKKLLIVEGITEEILLPVFANKLDYDFDANAIYIMGAGGKSKSPDLYLKLKNKLNIPVVILFDSDAKEICDVLKQNLSKNDKTIIIEKGEFEDILSLNLIKRALNQEYETFEPLSKSDLQIYDRMTYNIENYYKTRKLGEFKKSKLSKIIAKNVKYNTDITEEIRNIINDIIIYK